MTTGYNPEYLSIEQALRGHRTPFAALQREMAEFRTRPATEFEQQRSEMRDEMQMLNPLKSDAEVEKWVDFQIEHLASTRFQFSNQFHTRFHIEQVTVTLLSHALCEAVINAIIAMGLAVSKTEQLFNVIERANVQEKWLFGPKCFEPSYQFPKDGQLYQTLWRLCKWRNAFTHFKITLQHDEKEVITGSKLERLSYQETSTWISRFFDLPYELHAHACSQIRNVELQGMIRFALFRGGAEV